MITDTRPIGVFDSGIGGLTVAHGLAKALPAESIIYFGDTAHMPYGEKSATAILSYVEGIVSFLMEQDCKMIVIACNTASAIGYELLKARWGAQLPIVDVIHPMVDWVETHSFKKVGVIATKATIRSDIYAQKLIQRQPHLEVTSLATSLLASMIEEGFIHDRISHAVLHQYLSYPDFQDIEALLLACTHYPLIRSEIEAYFEGKIKVLDSVETVVEQVTATLQKSKLAAPLTQRGRHQFIVSDYTPSFEQTAQLFYGEKIQLERIQWKGKSLVSKA